MPPTPEVSTASLELISDEDLQAFAELVIANSDLARAKRRTQLPLAPATIKHYLQEPRSGIEMNDPWVARVLAQEIFARYLRKLEATQPPDTPPGIPKTSGVPEA